MRLAAIHKSQVTSIAVRRQRDGGSAAICRTRRYDGGHGTVIPGLGFASVAAGALPFVGAINASTDSGVYRTVR
jgi:hypothetical protein